MDYNVQICDMTIGQVLEGFYVLDEANAKTTATGKPFLNAVISGRTGKVPAMVWDYSGPVSAADIGKVVKVRGEVSEYRGTPQITVEKIRLTDANDHY